MRRSLGALCLVSALHALGVVAQDYGCVNKCTNDARNLFATHGCSSADDSMCLCKNDSFVYSARDCSVNNCGISQDQVIKYMSTSFCTGVTMIGGSPSAPPPESTSAQPTSTQPTSSEVSERPSTTDAPTSTAPTSSLALTGSSSSSPEATASPSTTAGTYSAAETSSTASHTSSAAATHTSSAAATTMSHADNDETVAAGGGLSRGAAVGIGVAVAVVFIAAAAVAIVILLKRRRQQQAPERNIDISRPMPSGRGTGLGDHDSFEKRGADSIEMVSNRYEDMLPRQTPRTMV